MVKLYSALIGLSLIWGTSFLLIKLLLEEMGPATVVFGRCLFGALLLLVIMLLKRQQWKLKTTPFKILLIVALLNNLIPWLLITYSETKIPSGLASIINATTPIWTLLLGFFFFSTVLRINQWAGIIIGFLGILVLSELKPGDLDSSNTIGVAAMTGATLCYGMASHLTKKYLMNVSNIEISFYTLAISSFLSLAVVLATDPHSLTNFADFHVFALLLGLGSLGSGIAYLLFYYMIKEGGPEFASLVTYLVPISALVWGSLLLKESISPIMAAGLVIIFTGVYVSSRKTKMKKDLAA